MLMLDRVISFDETTILAEKDAPADAFYFQGHFPGNPIMPGVMIVEAVAQSGALLCAMNGMFDTDTELLAFAGVDGAKFRRSVYPGDTLSIETKIVKQRRNLYKFEGSVSVGGARVTTVSFSAASAPRLPAD